MTEENKAGEQQQVDPNAKGLPAGVDIKDTDAQSRGEGAPKAPVIENAPPEPTAEEKAAKEAADKAKVAEAEQVTADQKKKDDEQKAKDEEDKKNTEEVKLEDLPKEYPAYNDPDADAVVDILKEAGISAEDSNKIFFEASKTGDFTKVDRTLLEEKLGKSKANLVILGAQSYYNKTGAKVKETVSAVHAEVGGEENYKKVLDWARDKADKEPEFRTTMQDFNAMFDLNKTAAVQAAKQLTGLYEADSKNSSLTRKQVHGDSVATLPGQSADYISRADYLTKLKEADLKGNTHEVNRLNAQRKASIEQEKTQR